MDTTPASTSVLLETATARTIYASATYVVAEPTITHINHFAQSAAYVSMRIITVGGLTLLLIGLCCLAAVLLRFSQHGEYTIHRIEREKIRVLNQETINKSFPIRIYPSQQRIFLDKDDQPIACTATQQEHESFTSKSSMHHYHPSTHRAVRSDNSSFLQEDDEKVSIQFPPQHSFMGLSLVGRIWSRDSSRCNSVCNSPCPNQAARMPSFTTAMVQKSPVRPPSSSFAIPIHPEQTACEISTEPVVTVAPSISEDLCSICLGEYAPDDRLRLLPCGHEYHAECVDIWLTLKSTYCPLCKHDLLQDVVPITPTTPMHIVEVPY